MRSKQDASPFPHVMWCGLIVWLVTSALIMLGSPGFLVDAFFLYVLFGYLTLVKELKKLTVVVWRQASDFTSSARFCWLVLWWPLTLKVIKKES